MSGEKLCGAARDGDAAKVSMLLSAQGAQFFINYQNARGATPLFFAARNGHAAVTKKLIAARCNVDLQTKNGSTPLHSAAYAGDEAVTEELIAARCNFNLQTQSGCTPLHCAAGNGHAAVTKQLIAARCNVDLQEENGFTSLHFVAQEGHAAVMEKLIAARCNVNTQNHNGWTPLHIAAGINGHAAVTDGNSAVIKLLLAARCNIDLRDKNGGTALQVAELLGHAGIAMMIRNKKQETALLGSRVVINGLVASPELNGRTGTAVSFDDAKGHYSVELDDTSLMIKPCNLLPTASPEQTKKQQEGADRAMENNQEKNRLGEQEAKEREGSEAARELAVPQESNSGSGEAMPGQQLCEAARDGDGSTPLHFAAGNGHAAVTEKLLVARCDVNLQLKNGFTPLHEAAANGHEAVTAQLLAARCNVDLQEQNGDSPLYLAAGNGHAAITKKLLAARCNVDLLSQNGSSPLHIAAGRGHAAVTKQLILARCSVDLQDKDGDTPLHEAAENGHAAVAKQLISARCNVNLQKKNGFTPLHAAANKGHAGVTEKLLAARCIVDLQTKDGATPFHFAAYNGHVAVTKLLLVARCNVDLQAENGATALQLAAGKGHAAVTKQLLAACCNVDLKANNGVTALRLAEGQGHAGIATLIRNQKHKCADRATKGTLLQASPEEIKKQQEDADRAMMELLKEEDKDAAAAVSQKKKQAKKSGNERRRDAADGQDGSQKEEHAKEQKDAERTEAHAVSEKKTANVAAVAVAAAHKDKAEERGEEEEEGKQWAAERQEAEGAGQGIHGRGLSQEKDDDDGLQDESPAKRKSKSKKKRAGNAEQCGASAGGEGGGRGADVRFLFSYESLSKATKNFEKRLGGGGCGSVFQGVLVSGTRVAVKRLELGVAAGAGAVGLSMADQMRTEVEVLSQVQHVNIVPLLGSSKDGMVRCLVYALMEGGSLQDRLACRGSGALVPLTANERILVLSDVARGLAYLHSEVRVIHGDVKSANVLLDEGCRGRIGDFGIAKSLNDKNAGIAVHVTGTQVYMAPEYIKGELSTKVDAFAFGLVIIETLTGYVVCSPAPGHSNLLSMFEQELDTASKLLAHLDKRACWDQHKQVRIGRLYDIADRCLEPRRKKRPDLVELIPELEELRRSTHALQAEVRMLSELNSFHCPLTMEVMREPVMTADGQTYERAEIESWFALGNRTSPLTGAELPSTNLTPNIALRNVIHENGLL